MAHSRAPANNPVISQPSTCLTSSSLIPGQPPTNGSRPAWRGDEREGHQQRFSACWRGGNAQQGAQTFAKSHLCPVSAHCSQPFSCFCKQHAGKLSAPRCILPAPGAQLSTKEPGNTPALCLHLDEPALPPGQSPAGRQNHSAALGRDARTSPASGSSGGAHRPPAPTPGRSPGHKQGQGLPLSASLHPPHAPETGCNRRRGSCPTGEEKFTVTGWCPVGKAGQESCLSAPFPSPSPTGSAPHGVGSQLPPNLPGAPPVHVTGLLGSGGEQQDKEPEQRQPPRGTPAEEAETQGLPTAPPRDPPPAPPSRARSSPWAHGARCPPPVRGSARLRSARLGPGAERGGAGAAEGSARPQPPVPGPGGRWWIAGARRWSIPRGAQPVGQGPRSATPRIQPLPGAPLRCPSGPSAASGGGGLGGPPRLPLVLCLRLAVGSSSPRQGTPLPNASPRPVGLRPPLASPPALAPAFCSLQPQPGGGQGNPQEN